MSQQAFSISNYMDSVKSPATTLSGFLVPGVSVATLLPRSTGGHRTGVATDGSEPSRQHPGTSSEPHCFSELPKSPGLQSGAQRSPTTTYP